MSCRKKAGQVPSSGMDQEGDGPDPDRIGKRDVGMVNGTKPKKRLTSKVWEDFIPTFVDGKLSQAECMHCHRIFNCRGASGTTSLRNHQAKCSPGSRKRPRQQENMSVGCIQKSMAAVRSDPKQKKLPSLLFSQKECTGTTTNATTMQKELQLPKSLSDTHRTNQEVHQDVSHERLAAHEGKNLALPGMSAEKNTENQSRGENEDIPTDPSRRNLEVDGNYFPEKVFRILAMQGHHPRMMEQDGFKKLVSWLNPMAKMPSHTDICTINGSLEKSTKTDIFDKLWDVKKEVHVKADMYRQPHYLYMEEQAFSNVRWEMQKKFNERWKVCFFHLCESSVLQWWKEHSLTYPTIARMARDILALPASTDCKTTKTARIAMSEFGRGYWDEQVISSFSGYPSSSDSSVIIVIDLLFIEGADLFTFNFLMKGMEAVVGNTSDDVADEEESTGSVSSPLFSDAMPKKRLRSKVWDDFIPTFVDGKIAGAQCMHCCQTFNCTGTTGTTSLRNHLARCSPETQKRPRQQEHTSLPSTQKGTTVGSDPKQKRLPFLLSRQIKCADTADAMPLQEIVLPDIGTKKNRKNQEVDRNGCHEELAEPEFSTDHNQKNQSHEQTALSEQDIPNDTSRKNQKVDQNCSPEEFVRLTGHTRAPSKDDGERWILEGTTRALFQFEKSKLKEKLAALCGRNQQKIIKFSPMDSSCSARELSDVILGAIREWGLYGKVFSIILDDAFVDDSVASDVKVTQVGLDELEKIKEKSAKCSKYRKESNCRNVPSPED
ncbi:hypothetical protein PR202_ga15960 [Eleusine coracana subsp. coracana]|uniref:BED-type domain-containing protein n=1 Tax=Eleusine coracana subsp. coracana TaxID=191504 RepID=A0AAV5CLL7_ELECO|nr:hypothetical protein PR202_ga15960 [Eleusine coracana subsp. coracana]